MSFKPYQRVAFRIAVAAVLVMSAADARAGLAARYNHQGRYFDVYGSDSSGCIWLNVTAWKAGAAGAEESYVSYWAFDQCAGTLVAGGYGRIANADFVITDRSATLNTTPGSNPTFPFTREGATGSISLTVTQTGLFSYSSSGHTRWQAGPVAVRSYGSYSYSEASAAGNVIEVQLSSSSGQIGSSRERTIEIERR